MQEALEEVQKEASEFKTVEKKKKKKDKKVSNSIELCYPSHFGAVSVVMVDWIRQYSKLYVDSKLYVPRHVRFHG